MRLTTAAEKISFIFLERNRREWNIGNFTVNIEVVVLYRSITSLLIDRFQHIKPIWMIESSRANLKQWLLDWRKFLIFNWIEGRR